jgi:hypothetical protein
MADRNQPRNIFSLIAARPVLAVLLLVALGSIFFVPGLGSVHLFDWDEANFAEASREMLSRHNWLQVTIDYRPFYQKPPLYFWLQALSMNAFGVNEFAARFVNAACGIATLVAVFLVGSRIYTAAFGLLWALAFLGSFLPHLFFKSGVIDPLFNLLIFLGISCAVKALMSSGQKRRGAWYAAAGLLIGLATLAKGPVALLVFCLTLLVYWASVRFACFFSVADALAFFAAAAVPPLLFFGIETATHGTAFIRQFIAYQVMLFATSDSGHGRPFYFHFFVILFGCFPASFFAIQSFVKRHEPEIPQRLFNRFMVILFAVILVLFSIVKTKTVLYSSLTWFPVTYFAALYCFGVIEGKRQFKRPLLISLSVFSFLVCLAITLFPVLMVHKEWIMPLIRDKFAVACLENPVRWSGLEFLLGVGYACAMAASIYLFVKKRPAAGAVGVFGSSALCLFFFMFVFADKIEQYSQGGPIAFYKAHATEDAYVCSLFKSYTDLFYSRRPPPAKPRINDINWLLRGPIDKPAYFVARTTQSKPYDDPALGLVRLAAEYGFVYYRRDVPADKGGNF